MYILSKSLSKSYEAVKLIMMLTILNACATGGKVVVRTVPENASVYFIEAKSGSSGLIGKSPLTFERKNHATEGSDLVQLRIEKEGFEPRYAAITAFGKETTYLDLTLAKPLVSRPDIRDAFEQSRRIMDDVNRLLLHKRFSEALLSVEKVLQLDPKNAEAMSAKGSVLYLLKDFDGATTAWTRALELNPSLDSVRESLIQLNNERPSRSPASGGGE